MIPPQKLPQGFWERNISRLTDMHCHLGDVTEGEALEVALTSGLTFHNMSVTPEQYFKNIERFSKTKNTRSALGLYPLYTSENSPHVKAFFEALPHCALVGEVGLDFSPDYPPPQRQTEVFKDILDTCHRLGGRCLSIHSRKAGAEVLELCWPKFNGSLVLHWYSGPCEALQNLPEHLYFSINRAMLKSRNGRALLEQLPQHKILLESDAPYIQAPSKTSIGQQLQAVVQSLALRWNLSIEDALEQCFQNTLNALKPMLQPFHREPSLP
jgi:TatD DNase family protein